MKLQPSERSYFKNILINHFTLIELNDLAFDLGIDYEIFNTSDLRKFALDLIQFAEKRNQFSCLFEEVEKKRTKVFLQDARLQELAAKIPPCELGIKVQVIINAGISLGRETIYILATELGVKESQVSVITGAIGSTRWLISLPNKSLDIQKVLKNISLKPDNKIIVSLVLYEMLSVKAQYIWRLIAFKSPPKLIDGKLIPSITWKKATNDVEQLLHLPHSTINEDSLEYPSSNQPSGESDTEPKNIGDPNILSPLPSTTKPAEPIPEPPPPTDQPSKPFPPPPIIQPSQPTPPSSPPPSPPQAAEDGQEASPVENIALPIINLGGGSAAQSASSPDIVEEEEESGSDR